MSLEVGSSAAANSGKAWDVLKDVLDGCILTHPATKTAEEGANGIEAKLKNGDVSESEVADLFWLVSIRIGVYTSTGKAADAKKRFVAMKTLLDEVTRRELIDPWLLRARLEADVLEACGLVNSEKGWSRKIVQRSTRVFYTQQKFNLLREESEGYSKLLTELVERALDPETDDKDVCARVVSDVQSLIGFFVLDPNRVVDLTLTAFEIRSDFLLAKKSPLVQKMSRLFNTLLRLFKVEYVSQLMGFKFQRFHEAEDEDGKDGRTEEKEPQGKGDEKTHASLFFVAAILIKEGIIQLDTLWPHLSPKDAKDTEDDVLLTAERAYRKKCDEIAKKAGIVSLVARDDAGPGGPEDNFAAKAAAELAEIAKGPFEGHDFQKMGLLVALLQLGMWSVAEELCLRIGSDEFAVDIASHPPVAAALVALADAIIAPTVTANLEAQTETGKKAKKAREEKKLPVPLGAVANGMVPALTSAAEWAAAPKSHSLYNILRCVSGYAYRDTRFVFRLCRLFKSLGSPEKLDPQFVELIVLDVLLPATAFTRCNVALANEVWDAVKQLPYDVRYGFYRKMRHEKPEEIKLLAVVNAQSAQETRRILRRLAKENEKQAGRSIAKATHGNCLAAFDVMLEQVKGYENIIPTLVEALKYISSLSFDMLIFSCIEQLTNQHRDRLKQDGTNVAQWFANLCTFTGTVLRKYAASIDLRGPLSFLFNRLRDGDALMVILMRETLSRMTGLEMSEELSLFQLESLGGSPTLRESVIPGLVYTAGTSFNLRKPTTKLRDALITTGLCSDLAVAVAHQREDVIFGSNFRDRPLKIIGNIYDRCQEVLWLYADFLTMQTQLNNSGGGQHLTMRGIGELVKDYFVKPDVAFLLNRFRLKYLKMNMIDKSADAKQQTDAKEPGTTTNGDVVMTDAQDHQDESNSTAKPPSAENAQDQTEKDASKVFDVAEIRQTLPGTVWETLTPELYSTFWALTLYDIHVPKENYRSEISRLRSMRSDSRADNRPEEQHLSAPGDKKKLTEAVETLENELKEHEAHCKAVIARLNKRKAEVNERLAGARDSFTPSLKVLQKIVSTDGAPLFLCVHAGLWSRNALQFFVSGGNKMEIVVRFLERCILPRSTASHLDAIFAARFPFLLQSIDVDEFRMPVYISFVCRSVGQLVFSCTEAEAGRFGRYLLETLMVAEKWRSDRKTYELECAGKRSFTIDKEIEYPKYVSFLHKMHMHITKAFVSALDSKEYMEVRNTLVVLNAVASVYPKFAANGRKLIDTVVKLKESEREDIKLMSKSYAAVLEAGLPALIPEADERSNTSRKTSKSESKPATEEKPDASPPSKATEKEEEETKGDDNKTDIRHALEKGKPEKEHRQMQPPKEDRRQWSPKRRRAEDEGEVDRDGTAEKDNGSETDRRMKRSRPREGEAGAVDEDQMKRRRADSASPRRVDTARRGGARVEYGPNRPVSPRGSMSRSGNGIGQGSLPRDRERSNYAPSSATAGGTNIRPVYQNRPRRGGGRDDRSLRR